MNYWPIFFLGGAAILATWYLVKRRGKRPEPTEFAYFDVGFKGDKNSIFTIKLLGADSSQVIGGALGIRFC